MTTDNKSHIEDIINALKADSKENINKDEIEEEFNKFMEYGVPIEQAKQTLLKKYGGVAVFTGSSTDSSERTLIGNLKPNQSSVKLLGHVIAINPKDITVKGENRQIFFGILGDESGTVQFTSWSQIDVEKGDVVEISNAYTKEWQGAVQLNLGDRVKVEKTEKEKLPESAFKPHEVKVADLHSGMGQVDVTARLLEVNERDVTVNEEKKKVFSGLIADETGKAQFTSWHDFKLKPDTVLQISGGYVKTWKGIPQLTFDQKANVTKLDSKKIPKTGLDANKMPIHTVIEKRGVIDVIVQGTVIDIKTGSGFIQRCPECNRVVVNDNCSIHGSVKGKDDFRIKVIVDDGTGAVDSSLNRELSEKITGITLEDAKKMSQDDLIKELHDKLFTKKISVQGNALSDDYGTSFIPKSIEFIDVDVSKEAEKIAESLEGLM